MNGKGASKLAHSKVFAFGNNYAAIAESAALPVEKIAAPVWYLVCTIQQP